jgi:hypothetical protein
MTDFDMTNIPPDEPPPEEFFGDDAERMYAYREVFCNSPAGRRVLGDMLSWMRFFEAAEDDESRILVNVARELLTKCGILNNYRLNRFVDAICRVNCMDMILPERSNDNDG